MIEIQNNQLVFTFPEVHASAMMRIDFQRTLRIPDDGKDYPLLPGLDRFPLCHVDDHAGKVPSAWVEHGGIMLPMAQSEALQLIFNSEYIEDNGAEYPFAVMVAAGKINALTGQRWENTLSRHPQNYLVIPEQRYLDGYCSGIGTVRQFVATPMGTGQTVEEQITGQSIYGGLQIMVFPMSEAAFIRRFPSRNTSRHDKVCESCAKYDIGLAPGWQIKQIIHADPYDLSDWDTTHTGRCFAHIANSGQWRQMTGMNPPAVPPSMTGPV